MQVVGGRPPRGHPSGWTSSGLTEPHADRRGARGFQAGPPSLTSTARRSRRSTVAPSCPSRRPTFHTVYAALRDDIANRTSTAPNITHAVHVSHVIDDLLTSAGQQRTVYPAAT